MHDLSQPFQMTDDGSVCRLILPQRELGESRRYAWIPLALGVFGLLFMSAWIGFPLTQGLELVRQGQPFGWLIAAFGLLGLAGLRMTLLLIAGSVAALRDSTQCVVEVRRKHLVTIEKFGWLKWRRKTRLQEISKLSVGRALKGDSQHTQEARWLGSLANAECVVAHLEDKQFPVAVAYPRDVLVPLANELATRLNRQLEKAERTTNPVSSAARSVIGTEEAERPRVAVELETAETPYIPEKPIGSSIERHEVNNSTVFEVPAMGVWKGSKGLAFFACLWNGFMAIFTTFTVIGIANGEGEGAIVFSLFLVAFWGIGISLALGAINMGRRSTMIGVVGDELFVKTKSIFGEKKQQVALENLAFVESGPSGMSVNDDPIYELQIHPRDGKKIGLLSQRSDDELEWLAYELRSVLNLDPTPEHATNWQNQLQNGEPVEPASGAIECVQTINGKQINVPPAGWKHHLMFAFIGIVLTCVGAGVMLYSGFGANQFGVGDGFADLTGVLFGLFFLAAGVGMFVVYRLCATRRFEIQVTGNELKIERYGLLSRKTFAWSLENIERVDRQRSSTVINNVPLDELAIDVRDDVGLNLMTGRPRDEIDFVAAHINLELSPGAD